MLKLRTYPPLPGLLPRPVKAGARPRGGSYSERMAISTLLSVAALSALVPAAIAPLVRPDPERQRDGTFWLLIGVAIAGPLLWVVVELGPNWRTGLAAALWLSIATSLMLFALVAAIQTVAWRLAPLLLGYLFLLGVMATIWQHAPERDQLDVKTPIGNTVASLSRDCHGVTLKANGKEQYAADVETLTEATLGWPLPLSNLA